MKNFKQFINENHMSNEENKTGIDFQDDFTFEEEERIEDEVQNHIADMVIEGYSEGELVGENPNFRGWFWISIEEDENAEDTRNQKVSELIRQGYTSGNDPTYKWSANVWK